jgi:hypothetical protein
VTEFRVDARRRQRPNCARCGFDFERGYSWHALGEIVVLCSDCASDIESSVNSYGESSDQANQRFLDKLREFMPEPVPGRRTRIP